MCKNRSRGAARLWSVLLLELCLESATENTVDSVVQEHAVGVLGIEALQQAPPHLLMR